MPYLPHPRSLRGVSGGVRQMERGAAPAARSEKSDGEGAILNRMDFTQVLRPGRCPHYPPSGTTTGCHTMALRAVG